MLVTSRAFAVSTVEEWKKRACANCFAVAAGRQTLHCEYCSQVFYCSAACDWDPQHSFPSLLLLLLEARKSKKDVGSQYAFKDSPSLEAVSQCLLAWVNREMSQIHEPGSGVNRHFL